MIEIPTLAVEDTLWQEGFRHIAGIDEAGRGALAGPVVAAAVIVPPFHPLDGVWAAVRDSKQLTPTQRARLEPLIQQAALAWGVGSADTARIDAIGIAPATKEAMLAALAALPVSPDYLLIDWVRLAQINLPQQSLIKADARIVSVAAASILAKVARDRLLVAADALYPHYGFAQHKGYGAATHLQAIAEHGGCPIHRRSFAPFRQDMEPRLWPKAAQ